MSPTTPALALLLSTVLSFAGADWQEESDAYEEEEVIFSTRGLVGAGNYSYYSLQDDDPVRLVLTTLTGDADLYVSEVLSKPTFELQEHTSSSASCGVDAVDLPRTVQRPVYVAVYGHPRYETSSFTLEVVSLWEPEDPFAADFFPGEEEEEKGRGRGDKKGSSSSSKSKKKNPTKDEWDPEDLSLSGILWDILRGILHILLEILL